MNVLVTGGAGFIGSHITELFCDEKHTVTVVDDLSFGYKKFVDKRAMFVKGNIGDPKLMQKLLKGTDVVIHLAASSIIKYSYQNPLTYYENNLINGIRLLEAMRATGVKKIINSSTAAVYGNQTKNPIPEEATKNPVSPYGSSKLAFEEVLKMYNNAYGIESTSLRYFNAYGPRDEQQPATRAVPMWIKAIINNKQVETYWQGKQLRDYIFVKDIARAHLAVLNLNGFNVYNIGSGKAIMMKNIVKEIEKVSDKKLQTKDQGERQGDPHKLIADISKIRKDVGWEPTVSIHEGLKQTFFYFKNNSK